MKWFRRIAFIVIAILLLQVVKAVFTRWPFMGSYFWANVVINIQFLLLSSLLLFLFFWLVLFFVKGAKRRKGLAILATILLLVFFEWSCSRLLAEPKRIPSGLLSSFVYYYDHHCVPIQFKENASQYNDELYYTLRPDASFSYRQVEFNDSFYTNRLGLRDDARSLDAPSVICLGDSYTLGWGVGQQMSYPRKLEQQTGLRVLNAGISSFGTARELMLLKALDTSRLKYLVIQYCSNDLGENETWEENDYHLPISSRASFDSIVQQEKYTDVYYPGKYFLSIGALVVKGAINKVVPIFDLSLDRDKPVVDAGKHADYFLKSLMQAPVDFSRTKIVVTYLDNRHRLQSDFLQQLELLSKKSPYRERLGDQFQVLDLRKVLLEDDYYRLDLHLKPSGQEKVATSIREAIGLNKAR